MIRATVSRPVGGIREVRHEGSLVGLIWHDPDRGWTVARGTNALTRIQEDYLWSGLRLVDAMDFARSYAWAPGSHWIVISGDHGYMPDYCDVAPDRDSAIDGLDCVHELSGREKRDLRAYGSCELANRAERGAEYCSVAWCECDEPWEHQDGMSKRAWMEQYGEEYGLLDEDGEPIA